MNDLLREIGNFLRAGGSLAWNTVRKHPLHVISAVVVVIAANQILGIVTRNAEREITVFVGPPGSSSYRMKDRIAEAIKGISTTPGFHYRAVVVPTEGYVDIEQRLRDDTTRQAIGLGVDGVQQDDSLRTLLPLDWDYLHVLASVKFLQRVRAARGGEWPKQFSDVVGYLSYDRVFSGPLDSGTRKFADAIFQLHGKSVEDYASPAIVNWEQAAPALKADRIDLAFYCGPLEAKTVKQIAARGTAVLLGLDDVQSSLVQQRDLSLSPESIPANFYSAAPITLSSSRLHVEPELADDDKLPPLYFGQRDIPTVVARRLIITSSRMRDQDAYYITAALTRQLVAENDIRSDTWKWVTPKDANPKAGAELRIRPHDGAALHRDNKELVSFWRPTTWSASWQSTLLGLGTLLTTTLLHGLVQLMRGGKSAKPDEPPPESASASVACTQLRQRCEQMLDELMQRREPLEQREHQEFADRIRELRTEIRMALQEERLQREEAHDLMDKHRVLVAELQALSLEVQP